MQLFETSWKKDFEFYERVYDTDLKKSISRKIDNKYEWYEQKSSGIYSYILDKNMKLEKKLSSNPKEGRDKYGFLDPLYKNIRDNYWGKDKYNLNTRVWYLDIETRVGQNSTGFPVPEKAMEEICLMQFYDNLLGVMFVIGNREWKHEADYKFDYTVKYIQCKDEIEILETFLAIFKKLDPLIIYAWNGIGFDYPYIYNRLKKLGFDTNRLSNYGNVKYSEGEFKGKIEFKISSDGHFFIDLIDIYKKFVFKPRPSYSLNSIAEIELGDKKVDHSEYEKFDDFYSGNYKIPQNPTETQKNSKIYKAAITGNLDEVRELSYSEFVYYGIKDTYLIRQIDDKLKFTSILFMLSSKMGVIISDATSTVKPWSQFLANRSFVDNKIMPPRKDNPQPAIVGGFVKDPIIGKHKWTVSADVNSMYPLLSMVGFNMSPETYIPKNKLPSDLREVVLKYFNDQDESKRFDIDEKTWEYTASLLEKYNYALSVNGAVFSKSKLGMIPELVQEIYNSRKEAKKTQFKYEQQKINIKEIIERKKNVKN